MSEVKRTQWFKHGDHPAVTYSKWPHLAPLYGFRDTGAVKTDGEEILVHYGWFVVEHSDGSITVEKPSE